MAIAHSGTPPQPYYKRVNGVLITIEPLELVVILGGAAVKRYPVFQFHRYRVRGDVAQVIELFRSIGLSDQDIVNWFHTPNPVLLGSAQPVDLVGTSSPDLFPAAKRHASQIQAHGGP